MRRFCAIVPHVSFVIRALVCYAKRSFPRHSERSFPRHSERLFLSFRAPFPVIPSAFSCHSERERGIHDIVCPCKSGCFTALRFVQHDTRLCGHRHNRFIPIRMRKGSSTPERTRTSNRQSRNLVLYPIELPVQT